MNHLDILSGCSVYEGSLIDSAANRRLISSLAGLREAMNENITLEAEVSGCDSSKNLTVRLGSGISGLIPYGEAAIPSEDGIVKDISILSRVGKPSVFKVTSVDSADGGVLLSRRISQEECLERYLTHFLPGDIIYGRILKLERFGAFLDIGRGVVSLLGVENISISRIPHPSERFSEGDVIPTVVSHIDRRVRRINLSHRELLGTWEQNAARLESGSAVTGIVRSIEDYGMFIELFPNLCGLAELRPGFLPGDRVSVYIKSISPERMKLKLSVISRLAPAPPTHSEYFISGERLDEWVYSPHSSLSKVIKTDFVRLRELSAP